MGELNITGYETTTLAEKILALQNIFKAAFGSDINLDLYSPQGKLITDLATLFDNDDKIGLNFFQQLDYHNATGALLSLIALSKGQSRRDGTKAAITATFTSSATGYTIASGSVFSLTTDSTITFQTTTDVTISNVSQVVSLVAINNGLTEAIITDNLTAVDYFPLLTDIEILTITDGTNTETDAELIARLNDSDTETGINDFKSVADKLRLVDGVTRVRVFDNATNAPVNGVPAFNLFCQVVGGADVDIAQCILDNKATGTPTYGNDSEIIDDSEGYPKVIYFNRPSVKTIYVRITLSERNGQTIDTSKFTELETNTQNYINALSVGYSVSYTAIFGIWAGQNFNIDTLELSFDGVSYVETDLTIAFTEYAYMDDIATKIEVITP